MTTTQTNRATQFVNSRRCPPAAADLASAQGTVIVETAIALPVLITLLVGIVTYGGWFMTAHSLQQAANEAAREALAGLDPQERRTIAEASVARSVAKDGIVKSALLTVYAAQDGEYLTVRLSYAIDKAPLFNAALLPLPNRTLARSAAVHIPSL